MTSDLLPQVKMSLSAAAVGDLDGDGRLDVVVAATEGVLPLISPCIPERDRSSRRVWRETAFRSRKP